MWVGGHGDSGSEKSGVRRRRVGFGERWFIIMRLRDAELEKEDGWKERGNRQRKRKVQRTPHESLGRIYFGFFLFLFFFCNHVTD